MQNSNFCRKEQKLISGMIRSPRQPNTSGLVFDGYVLVVQIPNLRRWPWMSSPKDHWTLKTGYFEDPTPAIQVQTLPLEGPRSLGREDIIMAFQSLSHGPWSFLVDLTGKSWSIFFSEHVLPLGHVFQTHGHWENHVCWVLLTWCESSKKQLQHHLKNPNMDITWHLANTLW